MAALTRKDHHSENFLAAGSGESLDGMLQGRLNLLQSESGYRFSLDSLLLARFVHTEVNEKVAELGAGSGIISLILARRPEVLRVTGVEIQEELVALARRNVNINSQNQRVEIIQADIREIRKILPPESFNVVLFNPPYYRLGSGRINPVSQKAIARHEIKAALADFIGAAGYLLPQAGRAYAIYPAFRLVELLQRLREGRLEPKRLQMVHSQIDGPAKFALVEGVKGAREELTVLPPLAIYRSPGEYSRAAQQIFADLAD